MEGQLDQGKIDEIRKSVNYLVDRYSGNFSGELLTVLIGTTISGAVSVGIERADFLKMLGDLFDTGEEMAAEALASILLRSRSPLS